MLGDFLRVAIQVIVLIFVACVVTLGMFKFFPNQSVFVYVILSLTAALVIAGLYIKFDS